MPAMTNERLPREERAALMRSRRRAALLSAAIAEAGAVGYRNMTRDAIAKRAGLAVGSVNHEFGTIDKLRDAVMAEAVSAGHLDIVRQGIANADPIALGAPADMQNTALNAI